MILAMFYMRNGSSPTTPLYSSRPTTIKYHSDNQPCVIVIIVHNSGSYDSTKGQIFA